MKKECIAKNSLINFQKLLDSHEFNSSSSINIKGIGNKKVTETAKQAYKIINDATTSKKSFHQSLCEMIECFIVSEKKVNLIRKKENYDFYKQITSYNNHISPFIYKINMNRTVSNMMDCALKNYPKSNSFFSSTPSSVNKLIKLLQDCQSQKNHSRIVFDNIKKIFSIIHEERNSIFFKSKKDIQFFNMLYNFVSFNEVKNENREEDILEAVKEAKNAVSTYNLSKKSSRNLIEVDSSEEENISPFRKRSA